LSRLFWNYEEKDILPVSIALDFTSCNDCVIKYIVKSISWMMKFGIVQAGLIDALFPILQFHPNLAIQSPEMKILRATL
jgi:hypothetical protein